MYGEYGRYSRGDEKRIIWIVAGIFLLSLIWSIVVPRRQAETVSPPAVEQPSSAPEELPVFIPAKGDTAQRRLLKPLRVVRDNYTVLIDPVGAVIRGVMLHKFTDWRGDTVSFLGSDTRLGGIVWSLESNLMDLRFETFLVDTLETEPDLVIEFVHKGTGVKRVFRFPPSGNVFGMEDVFPTEVEEILEGNISVVPTEKAEREDIEYSGVGILLGKEMVRLRYKWLTGKPQEKEFSGLFRWMGVRSKYFTAILIPNEPIDGEFFVSSGDKPVVRFRAVPFKQRWKYSIYVGPIDFFSLKKMGRDLYRITEFGPVFLKGIAYPMSRLLLRIFVFMHKWIPNYGLVIILFACGMFLIFSPITTISVRSMKKLHNVSARVEEIKRKYKKDPERMNKEIMELYKREGVNPFAGCLPLFFQTPVFIGLYPLLRASIELRRAPFVFWITDLSQKDPYYVLPILMAVAMIVQQVIMAKYNPGMKKQVTNFIFPLFMAFIFANFPSGLVLYWLSYSVFSVVQYFVIHKQGGGDGVSRGETS